MRLGIAPEHQNGPTADEEPLSLQLAEAERVLSRQNPAISADKLLSLAVKLAVEKHDQSTLTRLAKAAERIGNKSLAEDIRTAQKMAGTARTPEPGLAIEDLTPDALAVVQLYQVVLVQAKLAGRKDILEALSRSLVEREELSERLLAYLKMRIEQAIASTAPDQAARIVDRWFEGN